MPFVKLDCGILDSTLWVQPASTCKVFITMLAMANASGVVEATAPGIARRANLNVDAVRAALDTLEAPDPDSRSMNDAGMRVMRVDGGYRVVNYDKYRRKDYNGAERQQRFRERHGKYVTSLHTVTDAHVTPLPTVTTVTVTQAEAEAEKRKTQDSSERSAIAAEPAVISIPLVSGADYGITGTQLREYQAAYPGIDALAELKALRAWNLSNPKNRKTKSGVLRHVNAWLARAQNSARRDFGGTRNESAHRRFGEGAL